MPYINIKVTGGDEAPTPEQKKELIVAATEMVTRILGKNPASTVVIIEEIPPEAWGIGGLNTPERRALQKAKEKN